MAQAKRPCPTCSANVPRDAPSRPFCSERCKLIDLGRWLRGDYVVPGEDAISFEEVSELEARRAAMGNQEQGQDGGDDAGDDA